MWGDFLSNNNTQYTSIVEVFRSLQSNFGDSVFVSPKLSAFCIDLAPNLSNEIRLVKIASDAGIYQAIITANEETDTALLACVRQQRKKLMDTYFLSDVWAEQVIFWLLEVALPSEQYNELKRTFTRDNGHEPVGTNVEATERLIATNSNVATEESASPLLRFDGLYECAYEGYSNYLRFFRDSVVVSVSSTGKAEQVVNWFNHDYTDRGKYVVVGSHISFSCTSAQGTVDYDGVLTAKGMDLNTHSHINGRRASAKYRFVPTACTVKISTPASTVWESEIPSSKPSNDQSIPKKKKWPFRFGF